MTQFWMPDVRGGDAHHFPVLSEWREGRDGHFEGRGAGSWGLRFEKDLIVAMVVNNSSKEKIKDLTGELNAEKQLVKQRDEQLAAANQKMKSVVA